MGSYRRCETCWNVNDQVLINEIDAQIAAIGNFKTLNDLVAAETTMNERLQKEAELFRFEIGIREEQRTAQQTQIAAFFEAERLEKARLAEIAIQEEQESVRLAGLEVLRLGELEDAKSKVNKEHLVIGAAAVGVASFVL